MKSKPKSQPKVPALLVIRPAPGGAMVYVKGHLHAVVEKTAEGWALTAGFGVLAATALRWISQDTMVEFFRQYAYCIDRGASDATIRALVA